MHPDRFELLRSCIVEFMCIAHSFHDPDVVSHAHGLILLLEYISAGRCKLPFKLHHEYLVRFLKDLVNLRLRQLLVFLELCLYFFLPLKSDFGVTEEMFEGPFPLLDRTLFVLEVQDDERTPPIDHRSKRRTIRGHPQV
jgi:hypothetical protein